VLEAIGAGGLAAAAWLVAVVAWLAGIELAVAALPAA